MSLQPARQRPRQQTAREPVLLIENLPRMSQLREWQLSCRLFDSLSADCPCPLEIVVACCVRRLIGSLVRVRLAHALDLSHHKEEDQRADDAMRADEIEARAVAAAAGDVTEHDRRDDACNVTDAVEDRAGEAHGLLGRGIADHCPCSGTGSDTLAEEGE